MRIRCCCLLRAFCSFFVSVCSRPINSKSIRTRNTVLPLTGTPRQAWHRKTKLQYEKQNRHRNNQTNNQTTPKQLVRQNTPVNVGTADTQERTLRLPVRGGRKASCARFCGGWVGNTCFGKKPTGLFPPGAIVVLTKSPLKSNICPRGRCRWKLRYVNCGLSPQI